MKASSAIGIVVSALGIAIGATMEGSNVMAIINIPALLIVCVGTFGAAMASVSFENVKKIPALYRIAFASEAPDLNERVDELVGFAEKARREGLLALDDQLAEIDDRYTRKGLQLVVDGTDPDLVADILEAELDSMAHRHHAATSVFEKAGGYAPTMGIIGTVFGLVHVLNNLDAPETLGPAIAAAFIATLLGVASANVLYLPVANRLKAISADEQEYRRMTLEGILAIQSGDNPRVVAEKLQAFVPPGQRRAGDAEAVEPGAAPAAPQAAAA
jgi:chemotaxis protein MotA